MGLKHEYKTVSRCLHCLKPVNAEYVEKNNKLFLKKLCDKCGVTSILVENDASFLEKSFLLPLKKNGLRIGDFDNYIINLYLTHRCNSKCKVCLSKGLLPGDMTLKRIEKLCKKHDQKFFLLLGGEPTLREDLFNIIKLLKDKGKEPILFTNGLKLSDKNYVKKLKKTGLRVVYLSLDCLDEKINQRISGCKEGVKKKLRALKNLESECFNILLSAKVIGGLNDGKIGKVLELAIKQEFIKEMWFFPAINVGRFGVKRLPVFTSDVTKQIQDFTSSKISVKDFQEFKRLEINIYSSIQKIFLKNFKKGYILSHGCTLPINKNSASPLFKLNEVIKLNNKLEGFIAKKMYWKAFFSLIAFLVRKKKLVHSAIYLFDRYFFSRFLKKLGSDILLINIKMLLDPKTFDFNNQSKEIEYAGKDAKRIKFY